MKKLMLKIVLGCALISAGLSSNAQTYTFTTCGATGRFGPTQAQVNATYTGPNPLTGNVTINTQGIQEWTVPATGTYRIEARGAKGEDSPTFQAGGPGISLRGDFNLTAGQVLKVAVGQIGEPTSDNEGAGGGGGSFVTDIANTPLIIAGGGGGGARTSGPTTPAVAGTTAQNGHWGGGGGTGGAGGNCGPCSSIGGGGGGGLNTNGSDGSSRPSTGGRSFLNGLVGGQNQGPIATGGGFGGGGGGANNCGYGGGGGGYSGGGPGGWNGGCGGSGGGGASINNGANQVVIGANNAVGTVIITNLCSPTIAPTITCPANITVNNDAGNCSAVVTYTVPTATDDCGAVATTLTAGPASGGTFPVGTTTVTYTATNSQGSDVCSFTVTVVDNEAPALTCPANITVNNDPGQCDAVVTYTAPVGTDNCAGVTTALTAGLASGSTFPVGTTTVTYTATDAASNSTPCSFTVTVVDNEAPALTCPANITVNNDPGQCDAVVTYTAPVGTDNCAGVTTVLTSGPASGSTFPVGTTTVTYTATDAASNSTPCSFTVTVVDNEAPALTCPANITVNNDAGQCDAVVTYTAPVGTDNCAGVTTTLTAGLASGSTFPVGTTTVTYTATDAASNSTPCSFTVTVVDAEAPSITCPANITVGNTPGNCSAVVNYTAPVGTDNCAGATTALTSGLASGSTFPVGTTTVTYTVTDASSNVDSCSFTVTVADSVAPNAICQNINAYLDNTGNITIAATSIDNGSTDDCALDSVSASPTAFTCADVGANNVTLYAWDTYGNVDSCVAVVTVMDTIAPTATCQNINAYLDNTGNVTITAAAVDGGSADACGIDSMTISPSTFTCTEMGANNVTLIVTDNNGNVDSCVSVVTVMDTLAPTVTCPSSQNVKANNLCIYTIDDYSSLASNILDNCSATSVTVTQSPAAGTVVTADNIVGTTGQTTVTIYVQDGSGNIDSCDFVVDVDCGEEFSIPNVFTPNGDGTNDVWNISGLDNFPNVTVSVFNRWGDAVFSSAVGYAEPWDGTHNGTPVPSATYYYVIVLESGQDGITGTINIIR